MSDPVRIKICGVTRPEDALAAASAGADAIGINFCAASKRRVTPERAREIAGAVQGRIEVWGVFVDEDPEQVRRIAAEVPLTRVQLHGSEGPETARALADLPVVKALRVKDAGSLAAAENYRGVWGVLLDAYAPDAAGGTGRRFDWSLIPWPWPVGKLVLAGGLSPRNVAAAVRVVRPDWIDTASGVERAPGEKDPDLVREFVEKAHGGEGEAPFSRSEKP
jgi:phosphoribosylanthranilate isomerase